MATKKGGAKQPAAKTTPAKETAAEKVEETQATAETQEVKQEAPAETPKKEEPVAEKQEAPKAEEVKPAVSAKITNELSPIATAMAESLNQYVAEMSPGKPVTEARGAANQAKLFSFMGNMLNLEGKELSNMSDIFRKVIQENRGGCFKERYVFRFMDQVKLTAKQRKCFEVTMNLYLQAADTKSKQPLAERVDISQTALTWDTGERQQRLLELFS